MKCEECGGTGKVGKYFYEKVGFGKYEKVYADVPCEECAGTGEVEMTNEEWFCSLSTEEKAKWLGQRSEILYDCGQRDVFPKIMYEEDWKWWLKQPHSPKE